MLRTYRPDHILNTDYGWRYSGAVTTDVKYGSENVKFDRPELQDYQNIIMNGGICGRRAFFGRFILRCFGNPTVARPQVGHGALARWTPDGWIVNLGAGWGSRESNGVMQMTDADFVLETQVRKFPAGHEQALRAQWVGDALGEAKYVSMEPGSGGLWNVLSQFQKKLVVADTAGPASHAAWRGEVVLEKDARIEHADADFLDFDGDGAEDCLSVAFLKGGHQRDELKVRNHAREQFAWGNLSGHHGTGGTEFFEGVQHLAELADGYGAMVGGGEGGDEGWVGLFFKGDQLHLGAAGAGTLNEQGGVAALAGDDRHGLRGVEARGEDSRG
jgi:hypothetical protein